MRHVFQNYKIDRIKSLTVGCCVRSHRLIMWNSGTNINEYTIEHSRIVWHVNCCAYCSEPLVDQYLIEHPLDMIFFIRTSASKSWGKRSNTRNSSRSKHLEDISIWTNRCRWKKIVYYCEFFFFFFLNMSLRFMNLIESYKL